MDKDKRKTVYEAMKLSLELSQGHTMSQKEIADYIGVSPSMISYIASGKKNMSIDLVLKVAAKSGVSLDYIYGLSNSMYRDNAAKSVVKDFQRQFSSKLNTLENSLKRDIARLKDFVNGEL